MKKVTATSLAIALMTSTSALAQTAKYDVTIAKAAAAKAAERVGEIRGSIDFDQTPEIVTKEVLAEKPVDTSFLPSDNKSNANSLPPMTSYKSDLDLITTGSIKRLKSPIKQKIIWDKFDRYGNPIK